MDDHTLLEVMKINWTGAERFWNETSFPDTTEAPRIMEAIMVVLETFAIGKNDAVR